VARGSGGRGDVELGGWAGRREGDGLARPCRPVREGGRAMGTTTGRSGGGVSIDRVRSGAGRTLCPAAGRSVTGGRVTRLG
jgi:hypothetical protein